jgi:hypothetical protein
MKNACGRAPTNHLCEELCMRCLWINTFVQLIDLQTVLQRLHFVSHLSANHYGNERQDGSNVWRIWHPRMGLNRVRLTPRISSYEQVLDDQIRIYSPRALRLVPGEKTECPVPARTHSYRASAALFQNSFKPASHALPSVPFTHQLVSGVDLASAFCPIQQ